MRSAVVSVFSRITSLFVLFYLFCGVVFSYVLSHAWVTDDAYTTFRVIDNFVNGFGLRWNVDDRVQVYTHPLWMLLHIPFYVVFGNIFLITIGISTVLGVAAVVTILRCGKASYVQKAMLVLLPLAASPTFCHFVISGLEVPLSLFLLGLFFYYFISFPASVYRLLCIASLALLTRFDNIIILLPALCWLAVSHRKTIAISRALVAVSPFIVWCLFSLFYYGFVFPNTKYAKLNTGIPQLQYFQQGLHYLWQWVYFDLVAFAWVCMACVCAGFAVMKYNAARKTEGANNEMAFYGAALIGIELHVAYVIAIGGDFMVGRFFITPFFLSVLVIYCFVARTRIRHAQRIASIVCITCVLAQQGVQGLNTLIHAEHDYGDFNFGIVDEWKYYGDNHMFSSRGIRIEPADGMAELGKVALHDWWVVENKYTIEFSIIGMYGYYGGPWITIIDPFALADTLLARLPVENGEMERIGHFRRVIPEGYQYARRTGDLSKMNPDLAKYYAKLRLVTSGPLFSLDRIKTIVGFQLAWYDGWRDRYLSSQ